MGNQLEEPKSTKSNDTSDSSTGSFQPSRKSKPSRNRIQEPVPDKISRFEILELLGSGSFGRVYRARDPRLEREVALKVPHRGPQDAEEDVRMFLHEARAAAAVHHPNICPVYEVAEKDLQYIVMAYIPGKSLEDYLRKRKALLKPKQVAFIIRRLALALATAHAKGIIHRDLKPSNILIDRDRKDVVLVDFGVARRVNPDGGKLTAQGKIMGTPAYMSPEQARGDSRAIGPTSDIYSLGVILYRLLTGRCPFTGTVPEILGKILHVRPSRPSKFRSDVDSELEAICLKAIAKNQADRYASMREMADDLGEYLKEGASKEAKVLANANAADRVASDKALIAEVIDAISNERWAVLLRRGSHPWWIWLVTPVLIAALVVLGVTLFGKPSTVTVQLVIQENLRDADLSFFLDGKPIAPDSLGSPIELTVGDHELVVKRGETLVRRYLFQVRKDVGPTLKLESDALPDTTVGPGSIGPPPAQSKLRLLVPAYFYPGGEDIRMWDKLLDSVKSGEVVAIVNPFNGPGKQLDPNYSAILDRAEKAGLVTIGYVHTSYGKRPLEQVEADVDQWFKWYPHIKGVFFDEQNSSTDKVEYYITAAQYVRNKKSGMLIVSNPGIICAREYFTRPTADVICVGEHGGGAGLTFPAWAWAKESNPERFAFLIYDVKKREQMVDLLRDAMRSGTRYIYVTDAGLQDAWKRLPTWWDDEVTTVRQMNQRKE